MGRCALAEMSLEAASAALGGEARAKSVWRLLRQGQDPFVECGSEGLGREGLERLRDLDRGAVLSRALRPEAVTVVERSRSLRVAAPLPPAAQEPVTVAAQESGEARWTRTPFAGDLEACVQEKLGEECGTAKFVLQLHDGLSVEAVLIPQVEAIAERRERLAGRRGQTTTLCVSSQVGCAQGCRFCRTASMGILRNLQPDEILAQVVQGRRLATELGLPWVTNVVLMGMGEPLANLGAVLPVTEALTDYERMALGAKKVSLSTVAPSPAQVRALSAVECQLAWSLHCADDELRKCLVPSARFPAAELRAAFLEVLERRKQGRGRRLMVAIVLIQGVNDGPSHALQLAEFLRPLVNSPGVTVLLDLIPYNDAGIPGFVRPVPEVVATFKAEVWAALPSLCVHVRHARGEDSWAACGQLATSAGVGAP